MTKLHEIYEQNFKNSARIFLGEKGKLLSEIGKKFKEYLTVVVELNFKKK